MVVYLAVEDDGDVARLVADGLASARDIDDAQAPHAEGDRGGDEVAVLVRSAMHDPFAHGTRRRLATLGADEPRAGQSRDSAHGHPLFVPGSVLHSTRCAPPPTSGDPRAEGYCIAES